ncbi:MAG: hypothetical protein WCJ30_07130 [Deltaproteobacteria bacterium]
MSIPRRPASMSVGSETFRGHSSPDDPVTFDEPTDPDMPLREEPAAAAPAETIEVEVVRERGPMKKATRWRALEIWTKNRVYSLDAGMICIEVIDRAAGRPDVDHPLLGGRLAGGQRKEGSRMKLAHPYPVPGTEAVFKLAHGRPGRFGQTSLVERVVLRVRLADVPLLESQPAWEDLASRLSVSTPLVAERGGDR